MSKDNVDPNRRNNSKAKIGFVMDFLVMATGCSVTEDVKTSASEVLLALDDASPNVLIVTAVEAFEKIPKLQEFAAQLRKPNLPKVFWKYFNPDEYHQNSRKSLPSGMADIRNYFLANRERNARDPYPLVAVGPEIKETRNVRT